MKHAQVIVTLEESVKVTPDVLGEELISLMVGSDDQNKNVPIKLCFPRGAQNAAERLSAPQLCFPQLSGGLDWGIHRASQMELLSLLVVADLPVEDEGTTHVFAMSCVPWARQLADWIAVLTGQLIGTRHRPGLPPVDDFYVKAALDTGKGVKPIEWVTLSRPRPKKQPAANLEHLKHALDHLSRNESAPLPHTLLVDAQAEQYRGAYERAIMDAYVAAETALAQAAGDGEHAASRPFKGKKWRENRGKWPDLPEFDETMSSLVRVRNEFAAHTRLKSVTAGQGYRAISVATRVVRALVPQDPPCTAFPAISSCPWRR